MDRLPVLDLSRLDAGPDEAAAFRDDLRRATHEVGFFHLVGHGIPEEAMNRAFATAEALFALPEEEKRAIEMTRSPHFRGWTRTGGERTQGQVDWREQIDLGSERDALPHDAGPAYLRLEGPNQWPEALPELREVFLDWTERCTAVGRRLMSAWAECLGAPADHFDSAFADRPWTLVKLVRYPGLPEDSAERQGVGSHKDPGVLTLLLVEPGRGGLQVEHDGGWIDVPPVPGAFVVNIGELLEFATSGYLRATVHRVVSPPPGETRLSIPFFLNPALDSNIPPVPLPPELAAEAPGVTEDPDNVISGVFGENMLKARLRAHPDVAAIHHADLLAGS